MYNELKTPVNMTNEPIGLCATEESIQSITADILNMSKHCRGISSSIKDGLFGPNPTNGQNEKSINCLIDALKETRNILRETIDEMESINRRL